MIASRMSGRCASDEPCVLETSAQYGLYSNWLLTYYTKHILASANDQLAAAGPSSELKLDIVPRANEEELELVALWEGKPKADVKMTVTVGDGDPSELKTDAEGKASLKPKGEGLVAMVANFVDETAKGDFNGKPYAAVASYATLTLPWKCPCSEDAGPPAETKKSEKPSRARNMKQRRRLPLNPHCHHCRSRFPVLARRWPMAGSMSTAGTPAPSTIIRPRISRPTFAACSSTAAASGKNCPCKRRCRGSRLFPTKGSSIASAA